MSKYGDLVYKYAKTKQERLELAVTAFLMKNASQLKDGGWVDVKSNVEYGITDQEICYELWNDTDFEGIERDYVYQIKFVGLPF